MPRYRIEAGKQIAFSEAEETARDAEEKAWADAAPAREMAQIRQHRDTLLRETDHFGLSDVTLTDEMKTYRQALRDIPASNTIYADVTWPTKPS